MGRSEGVRTYELTKPIINIVELYKQHIQDPNYSVLRAQKLPDPVATLTAPSTWLSIFHNPIRELDVYAASRDSKLAAVIHEHLDPKKDSKNDSTVIKKPDIFFFNLLRYTLFAIEHVNDSEIKSDAYNRVKNFCAQALVERRNIGCLSIASEHELILIIQNKLMEQYEELSTKNKKLILADSINKVIKLSGVNIENLQKTILNYLRKINISERFLIMVRRLFNPDAVQVKDEALKQSLESWFRREKIKLSNDELHEWFCLLNVLYSVHFKEINAKLTGMNRLNLSPGFSRSTSTALVKTHMPHDSVNDLKIEYHLLRARQIATAQAVVAKHRLYAKAAITENQRAEAEAFELYIAELVTLVIDYQSKHELFKTIQNIVLDCNSLAPLLCGRDKLLEAVAYAENLCTRMQSTLASLQKFGFSVAAFEKVDRDWRDNCNKASALINLLSQSLGDERDALRVFKDAMFGNRDNLEALRNELMVFNDALSILLPQNNHENQCEQPARGLFIPTFADEPAALEPYTAPAQLIAAKDKYANEPTRTNFNFYVRMVEQHKRALAEQAAALRPAPLGFFASLIRSRAQAELDKKNAAAADALLLSSQSIKPQTIKKADMGFFLPPPVSDDEGDDLKYLPAPNGPMIEEFEEAAVSVATRSLALVPA